MKTQDIKTILTSMQLDRCRNNLTDLRVILNIMAEQTSFNYQMAVQQADLCYKQGKFDELGLLLMTLNKETPGYDVNLVKNAYFLLEKISGELRMCAEAKIMPDNICSQNDNRSLPAVGQPSEV